MKIFEKETETENLDQFDIPVEIKRTNRIPLKFIVGFCLFIITILTTIILMPEKTEKSLVYLLEPDNNNIICRKVKYETYKKTNPDDTSGIFFEVVNSNIKKYQEGDLVKFGRHFQEQEIEGITYGILDVSQIQFILRKKDVKESIIRRE